MTEKATEVTGAKAEKAGVPADIQATIAELKEAVDALKKTTAFLDRKRKEYRDNWKKFYSLFVANSGDGKVGSVRTALVAGLAVLMLVVCSVMAVEIWSVNDTDSSNTKILRIQGDGDATGSLSITGRVDVSETLKVAGNSTLGGTLSVAGNTTISGTLAVTGAFANASTLILTNLSNAGSCSITMVSDIGTDAGDRVRLLVADGAGLAYQTDITTKGTYASKLTIDNTGALGVNEDVVITLNATDEEVDILNSTNANYMLLVSNSAPSIVAQTTLLKLGYLDDGQALADFISCTDNGVDSKFSVGDSGNVVAAGTLAAAAADFDSVTVNAGAGIDNQAAGTLVVGAATATRVEVADALVVTDIEGPLMYGSVTTNNVTAAAIAAGYSVVILNNANLATNTLANPAAAGQLLYILGQSATNTFIKDAANFGAAGVTNAGSYVSINANDVLQLISVSASKWLVAGFTAN